MKITDPTLWPSGLEGLHFEPVDHPAALPGETTIRAADGTTFGSLAPLSGRSRLIESDHGDVVTVPAEGGWELAIVDEDGELIDGHMLFRPAGSGADAQELGTETTAWATMTLLRRMAGVPVARG